MKSLPPTHISHLLSWSPKLKTTVYSFMCIFPEFIYSDMNKYKCKVLIPHLQKDSGILLYSLSLSSNQLAIPSFTFLWKRKFFFFFFVNNFSSFRLNFPEIKHKDSGYSLVMFIHSFNSIIQQRSTDFLWWQKSCTQFLEDYKDDRPYP